MPGLLPAFGAHKAVRTFAREVLNAHRFCVSRGGTAAPGERLLTFTRTASGLPEQPHGVPLLLAVWEHSSCSVHVLETQGPLWGCSAWGHCPQGLSACLGQLGLSHLEGPPGL